MKSVPSGKGNGGLLDEVAFLNSKDVFARVSGLGCYFFCVARMMAESVSFENKIWGWM